MNPGVGAGTGDAITVDVLVQHGGWLIAVPSAEALCLRAALAALNGSRVPLPARAEVCVLLANDATLQELNRRYRGEDRPTNVLSFQAWSPGAVTPEAAGAAPVSLGDIVIAFETARQEAAASAKTLANHLSHLVVHGMLHLMGFDHEADHDAEVMERLETEILATLGIADPYAAAASGTG